MSKQRGGKGPRLERAAGNGMLNRRVFLEGAFVAAATELPAEASRRRGRSRWRYRAG